MVARSFSGTLKVEHTGYVTLSDIVCVGSRRKSQAGAQRFAGIFKMVETGILALSGGIELDPFRFLR